MDSSSGFIVPKDFSSEWRDISLIQKRVRTLVYVGIRYGRRFVLKTIAPEYADLTNYRLQQEQEFQLGIQLVHPNIAATYSLEDIEGVGRCIVQEWIDGVTLGEWLQTMPSKSAQERVFEQLLDALEYLHSLQLVHHDLKADNILITRNGSNVKLIDFGLSALDATLSPLSNDPRADIQSLTKLFPAFVPKGHFCNVAELHKAILHRKRIKRALPVVLSVLLLVAASILFYLSWHQRHAEQQRYESMAEQVDSYMTLEREQLLSIINRADSYNVKNIDESLAYTACWKEISNIRARQWTIRDSLAALYQENDPLREQFIQLWNRKEEKMNQELYPILTNKAAQHRHIVPE